MLNIVICDNNPAVNLELTGLLSAYFPDGEYRCRSFETREELLNALDEGLQPDIAFLDILFGDENGVKLAGEVFPRESQTQVIFVTAYPAHAAEAYETDHVFVLMKPIQKEMFQKAMEKAMRRIEQLRKGRFLHLTTRKTVERIPVDTIRYIETKGRKLEIHCLDMIHAHYASLSAVMKELPDSFVHCHKSFCVNIDYIRRLEPRQMTLDDGTLIPISQMRRQETRDKISSYLL